MHNIPVHSILIPQAGRLGGQNSTYLSNSRCKVTTGKTSCSALEYNRLKAPLLQCLDTQNVEMLQRASENYERLVEWVSDLVRRLDQALPTMRFTEGEEKRWSAQLRAAFKQSNFLPKDMNDLPESSDDSPSIEDFLSQLQNIAKKQCQDALQTAQDSRLVYSVFKMSQYSTRRAGKCDLEAMLSIHM